MSVGDSEKNRRRAPAAQWEHDPGGLLIDRSNSVPRADGIANLSDNELSAEKAKLRQEREFVESLELFQPITRIALTAPQWLVKPLLEVGASAAIFGARESAKSLVGVSLAGCVTTGLPFHDFEVKRPGPVVYVAGEGHAGLRRRFEAWSIANDTPIDTAPLFISQRAVPFGDPESITPVINDIEVIQAKYGAPALVIVDTLSANIAGDENGSDDMPRFNQAVTAIRSRFGCASVVIHHVGHAAKERARGHSSFEADKDTLYRLDRDGERIVMTATKARDAARPDPVAFRIVPVELGLLDEDGEAVTSATVERIEMEDPDQARPTGKWQKQALETLEILYAEHIAELERNAMPTYEAAVHVNEWRARCADQDMPRQRFSESKNTLERNDHVIRDGAHYRPSARLSAVRPGALKGPPDRTDKTAGTHRTEPDGNRTETGQQADNGPSEEMEIF